MTPGEKADGEEKDDECLKMCWHKRRGGEISSPKKINDLYYRMHWMFNRKEHLIASRR